ASSPACGISAARAGPSAPAATARPRSRARDSSSRTTAARARSGSLQKPAQGLPPARWGRLAVAIAPSNPEIVYALIESTRSALFRSDDGGKTWEERDRSQYMVWRPFYFANLIIDPTNADRVFKPNLVLIASDDGGKSFSPVGGGTHGDHHDLWINPANPKHIITGDDGGLFISYDGGHRWWERDHLPG